MRLTVLIFLATLLSTSRAKSDVVNPIQLLRPSCSAFSGLRDGGLDCLSWRLAVETNNLQRWTVVPESCADYVGNYMVGKQYSHDCEVVANAAIEYAKSVKLTSDEKEVWVFDIDETTLSNLPYYKRSDVQFGSLPRDISKFYEWVEEGAAPAVPAILRLYNEILSLGFKTVILTGSSDRYKDIRTTNLKTAGYDNWHELIFKGKDDQGIRTLDFKSKQRAELVNEGYRIVGNIGDQWSDLAGDSVGNRTFKVPNPMYFV